MTRRQIATKMKYTVEYYKEGGKKHFYFEFGTGNELLTSFFNTDVRDFGVWFNTEIAKILKGESEEAKLGGNLYYMEVRRDKTKVIDLYAEEASVPEEEAYFEIDTVELCGLIKKFVRKKRMLLW